jgi:hypothetical protein
MCASYAGRIPDSLRAWTFLVNVQRPCGGPCKPQTPPPAAWKPQSIHSSATPNDCHTATCPPGSLPAHRCCSHLLLLNCQERLTTALWCGRQTTLESRAAGKQGMPPWGSGSCMKSCNPWTACRPQIFSRVPGYSMHQISLRQVCRNPQAFKPSLLGWDGLLSQYCHGLCILVP